MIKSLITGPLAVVLVAALPLLLVTGVLVVVVLVSLFPARKMRAHTRRLIELLTVYAAVLRNVDRPPPPACDHDPTHWGGSAPGRF
ncbi:MAG: hypothetical protein ACRDTH_03455 [Pseudonocardiaceae bacterium]